MIRSCVSIAHHASPTPHPPSIYICCTYWKLASCTYNLIFIVAATCHGSKMQVYNYQVTRATWYGYVFNLYISCVMWELQTCPPSILPSGMRASCIMYACIMYHAIVCMICFTLCSVCSLLTLMPHAPHAVQCCRHMFICHMCSCGYTNTTTPHPKPQTPDRHTGLL
jgi:hypothetical protein